MIKGLKATELLNDAGVKATYDDKTKQCTFNFPSAESVLHLWQATSEGLADSAADINKEFYKKFHQKGDDGYRVDFTGATTKQVHEAIEGRFDTAPFLEARASMATAIAKLETLDCLKGRKRRRFMSEHDGELDFDRLWDLNPFHGTRVENSSPISAVELTVDLGFSCAISHAQILEYGAMVWSVIDLLERSGIQCGVTGRFQSAVCQDVKRDDGSEIKTTTMEVRIKDAGQYVDTLGLARSFTPWFLRYCLFNTIVLQADAYGNRADYSLGIPNQKASKAEAGRIHIGLDFERGCTDIDEKVERLVDYIKTALTA